MTSPARAGAEEEMRMGTEEPPRSIVGEIATALLFWSDAEPDVPRLATRHCYEAAKAIVAASPILSWITANPEAAKGLAEDTFTAIKAPPEAVTDRLYKLSETTAIRFNPLGKFHAWVFTRHSPQHPWISTAMAQPTDPFENSPFASPPAPSGKAQHLQRPDVNHPLRSHNPMEVDDD